MVTKQDKRRVIRSGRRSTVPRVGVPSTSDAPWSDDTRREVITTMAKCRSDLVHTDFYQSLIKCILEKDLEMNQIVCYGIGNLAPSPTASMWQLACALTLREELNGISLLFYDPCTTPSEAQLMNDEWKIQVITENERGKRRVNGLTTLFFMPHCPRLLYANVLWANWNDLDRVLLFGNSLPLYKERTMEKNKFPESVSLLLPFVEEERVVLVSKSDNDKADGNLEGAFNDCYLTWISINDCSVLPNRPPELTVQEDEGGEVI